MPDERAQSSPPAPPSSRPQNQVTGVIGGQYGLDVFLISQSAHVAWGALGVLGAKALFPHTKRVAAMGAVAILAVAVVKEATIDRTYYNSTILDSTFDLMFYTLGVTLGFVGLDIRERAQPLGVRGRIPPREGE